MLSKPGTPGEPANVRNILLTLKPEKAHCPVITDQTGGKLKETFGRFLIYLACTRACCIVSEPANIVSLASVNAPIAITRSRTATSK